MPLRKHNRRKGRPKQKHLNNVIAALFIVFILVFVFNTFRRIVLDKKVSPTSSKSSVTRISGKPMLVVIVDDCGYSINDCDYISRLDTPATISVLPNLDHSTQVAACAQKMGKEVMLHLPLEPHILKEHYNSDYIITTDMTGKQVVEKIHSALASVPYAVGINNHMGSKATENRRLMSIVFSQLMKSNLFFVDSRVTAKTICRRLAREQGLPFAKRDVFLDNENDRDYIEGQYAQLKHKARQQGYAIGICHARPLSWQILMEQSRSLQDEGFELVTVNTLMKSF
ncbi:MAG: divergent polysaccharide deacetylase family protein [Candidatus Omnitrophica bacterium]|nr:divergent polysaccharide deacetylase family protein [Candidatus Omnitrophota bacterium]